MKLYNIFMKNKWLKHKQLQMTNNDIPEFSLNGEEFLAKVVDIYDADTCKIVILLNKKPTKFTCRLYGIDTPEMKPSKKKPNRDLEKQAAKKSRNRLFQLCCNVDCELEKMYKKKEIKQLIKQNNKLIKVKCGEFDKYGRLLIKMYDLDTNEEISFNQILINEEYAKEYFGKTKEQFTF